jgi:hypothetical protein
MWEGKTGRVIQLLCDELGFLFDGRKKRERERERGNN